MYPSASIGTQAYSAGIYSIKHFPRKMCIRDRIGTLAESFRKTVSQLNEYISYIKGLAYRDPITGVKSKTAYVEAVKNMESPIDVYKRQ